MAVEIRIQQQENKKGRNMKTQTNRKQSQDEGLLAVNSVDQFTKKFVERIQNTRPHFGSKVKFV